MQIDPDNYKTETSITTRSNITLNKKCKESINEVIASFILGVELFYKNALIPNLSHKNYSQRC